LSGRGLCDELITRPEESYRLWCVVVCDLETSRMGAPYIYGISRLRVNEKLHLSHSSSYTARVIKLRMLRWVSYVAWSLVGKPKETMTLGSPNIRSEKNVLLGPKEDVRPWTGFIWLRTSTCDCLL